MSKGIEFLEYFAKAAPPFSTHGIAVFGKTPHGFPKAVAIMHDYHAVSAEEQRQMALNTVTLCEMLYTTQESNHVC